MLLTFNSLLAWSDSKAGCEDSQLLSSKMMTDVCWSCIAPIKISGIPLSTSGYEPRGSASESVCTCSVNGKPKIGVVTQMWEPTFLVEFPVMPGCLSVMNGTHISAFGRLNQGHHDMGTEDSADKSFMHYHFYAYPLLQMVDLFVKRSCNSDGYVDLDLLYFSELDPTWNNDILAFFSAPESAAVANPVAVISCAAEATAMLTGARGQIDSMFWCAGAWGAVYPLSGTTTGGNGGLNTSSLLTTKVISALHRRGVMRRTMGNDTVCKAQIDPMLTKSQYKLSMIHPVPETSSTHAIGQHTMSWGAGRSIPAVGEDPIYMIWRWNDCCNHN